MNNIYNLRYGGFWILMFTVMPFICFFSCRDFIEVDPPKNQIISSSVYSSDATAISAINGIYSRMINSNGFASGGVSSISILAGRSADDFQDFSSTTDDIEFSTNSLTPENSTMRTALWQEGYSYVYNANLAIENLQASKSISKSVSDQLLGEALFIRAFCYFYLTNLFGDVPLIVNTDYRANAVAFRVSQKEIYDQIISDLEAARILVGENYVVEERIRPNKSTVEALLARVYLYLKDWEKAESASTSVIDNVMYSIEEDINRVFLKDSREAIWQLKPLGASINTWEGNIFILTTRPNQVALSVDLVNLFEDIDNRKINWIGKFTDEDGLSYYYPFKYKIQSDASSFEEYSMVFRLAEQYLIRSESRAWQDNLAGAIQDLDVIRERANLPLIQATNPDVSQSDLLLMIEEERRFEFFSEWGHRWLDLKRTNRANTILPIIKSSWQSTDVVYPIPQSERKNNINLSQNDGYF